MWAHLVDKSVKFLKIIIAYIFYIICIYLCLFIFIFCWEISPWLINKRTAIASFDQQVINKSFFKPLR